MIVLQTKSIFKVLCFSLILLFFVGHIYAQKSFDNILRELDPASRDSSLVVNIEIHEEYLADAKVSKDTQRIIFGYMYLLDDYISIPDYNVVMSSIQEAEDILSGIDNDLWKGQLNHRKGNMYTQIDNYESAIRYFELSLTQSLKTEDYQNVAITLEQLGAVYGYQGDFVKSDEYYNKAFKYLSQYCDRSSLAVAYSNYGSIKGNKGDFKIAIDYLTKALNINITLGRKFHESSCRSNIAAQYLSMKQYEKARVIWLECVKMNKANDWIDLLMSNYSGLSEIYEHLDQPQKALYYKNQYEILTDSLVGKDVNIEIATLELSKLESNKNIEILSKENEIQKTKIKYTAWIWLLTLIGFFVGVILLLLFLRKRKQVNELDKNKEVLMRMAKDLESKNASLLNEMQSIQKSDSESKISSDLSSDSVNPFTITILTNSDWQSFKEYFEKSHPNFIHVLRAKYPDLTEAEERLFLLLKLKLSKKEIANVLGILPDTVKKTRGRLRKRLKLNVGTDLDVFIGKFK